MCGAYSISVYKIENLLNIILKDICSLNLISKGSWGRRVDGINLLFTMLINKLFSWDPFILTVQNGLGRSKSHNS